MAVASFVVQTGLDRTEAVEAALRAMPGVTVDGRGNETTLVVLAEGPGSDMASTERAIRGVEGVLSVATVFLSIEDELVNELEEATGGL